MSLKELPEGRLILDMFPSLFDALRLVRFYLSPPLLFLTLAQIYPLVPWPAPSPTSTPGSTDMPSPFLATPAPTRYSSFYSTPPSPSLLSSPFTFPPWLFPAVPSGYWSLPSSRLSFLNWATTLLSTRRYSDLYKMNYSRLSSLGGSGLLSFYSKSPQRALAEGFPAYTFAPWQFGKAMHVCS